MCELVGKGMVKVKWSGVEGLDTSREYMAGPGASSCHDYFDYQAFAQNFVFFPTDLSFVCEFTSSLYYGIFFQGKPYFLNVLSSAFHEVVKSSSSARGIYLWHKSV